MARAPIHVATLPREWIAVLSSRTERDSDKRRIRTLYLGCCRCAAAAAVTAVGAAAAARLVLFLLLCCTWYIFIYINYSTDS